MENIVLSEHDNVKLAGYKVVCLICGWNDVYAHIRAEGCVLVSFEKTHALVFVTLGVDIDFQALIVFLP